MTEMTANHFYLGLDGGGTGTRAIVVDDQGQVRGSGMAGSANYAAAGLAQAVANIHTAINLAVQSAATQLPLHAAWLGIAGLDSYNEYDTLAGYFRPLATQLLLTNDAELVLGALDARVGVALIAGTGSIALGRDAGGSTTRTGGWGHLIGDEGSGFVMGQLALQAVSRAVDGRGPETSLLAYILMHWQINKVSDLISKVYEDGDKARIAQLSMVIMRAAREGDAVARKIVTHSARELALLANTAIDKLDFRNRPVPLALGGSLLLHEEDFRAMVVRHIRRHHQVEPLVKVDTPALSAARALIHLPPIDNPLTISMAGMLSDHKGI